MGGVKSLVSFFSLVSPSSLESLDRESFLQTPGSEVSYISVLIIFLLFEGGDNPLAYKISPLGQCTVSYCKNLKGFCDVEAYVGDGITREQEEWFNNVRAHNLQAKRGGNSLRLIEAVSRELGVFLNLP